MKSSAKRLIPLIFLFLFTPGVLHAQSGMLVKAVRELVENFTKSGATSAARELAEIGGEKTVQKVIEKAAAQGGDDLLQQVLSVAKMNGPRAIKAMETDPALMTKALKGLPDHQLADVVTEAARNPSLMTKLVRAHGNEVLTVSARHPSIGTQVIDEFGKAGLKAAKQLDTDGVVALARIKGFRELPESAKRKFTSLLDRNPKEVANFLMLTAGGTGIVLTTDFINKLEDEIFGKDGAPGHLTRTMVTYGWIVGGILAAALAGNLAIRLMKIWRKNA
jgi:hypothetical protein